MLGVQTKGLINNIGLEQEIFLVNRDAFFRRPDLQFTGRTVVGRLPARGQEMSDHYMCAAARSVQGLGFRVGVQGLDSWVWAERATTRPRCALRCALQMATRPAKRSSSRRGGEGGNFNFGELC